MSAYRSLIRSIQDGEPVDAAVANRPPDDVQGNVQYLYDWLESAAIGSALFWRDQPAAPDVAPGMPVYWDSANGRLDLALAAVTIDPATNSVIAQPTAEVVGICSAVYSGGTADVVTLGVVQLDVSPAVTGAVLPGIYYLSTAVPGGLVQQSPAISCPVLKSLGGGYVLVLPEVRNFLNDHAHFTFHLYCQPAGTTSPPSSGSRHVISADNTAMPGWLNAGNAIFNGLAPPGAVFGYNLAQHPALAAAWPPLPVGGVVLFWDQGLDTTGGKLLPTGTAGGLVVADVNGLWWMSNCYGDVPWPISYNSASPPAPPATDTTPPTCPRPLYMRLTLGYYISLFASRSAIVTQLRATPGSPIVVTNWQGAAATAGQLEVGFDWAATVNPGDMPGSEVLKTFSGGVFSKGFVTEGIQLAGTGLQATSTVSSTGIQATASATLSGSGVSLVVLGVPGTGYASPPPISFSGGGGAGAAAVATVSGGMVTGISVTSPGSGYTSAPTVVISAPGTIYQGVVTLQATNGSPTVTVTPDVVKLTDASIRSFNLPPYIGFPLDRASSILLEYDVPVAGLPNSPTASIQITYYGVGSGTIPPLTASYVRLTGASGAVPSATPLTLTTGQSLTTGNYLQASTASFPVAAGDTVFVTITRAGNDGYGYELGLIREDLLIAGG